jgi:hypothetical protein
MNHNVSMFSASVLALICTMYLASIAQARAENVEASDILVGSEFMIVSAKKVYFQNEDGTFRRSFLVQGDKVSVLGKKDRLVYVNFVNDRSVETIGYLPEGSLSNLIGSTLNANDFLGTWERMGGNQCNMAELVFSVSGERKIIAVGGQATSWYGPVKGCGPNEGAFGPEKVIKIDGGLRYMESLHANSTENCLIDFKLDKSFHLSTNDQSTVGCWGGGVSFTGLYVKKN